MMLRPMSAKNERIAKRTIYACIGFIGILLAVGILFTLLPGNSNVASAVSSTDGTASYNGGISTDNQTLNASAMPTMRSTTNAQRVAAAERLAAARNAASRTAAPGSTQYVPPLAPLNPGGIPDYFGTIPNYANSPLPAVDSNGTITGGIRKFVDTLPGLGPSNANNLGQYIPIAIADNTTYSGSDYYEIGLVEYTEKMHSDLNATILRGYVQLETSVVSGNHTPLTYVNGSPILNASGGQIFAVDNPHYLGPTIVAQKDRPVRVKFINLLPTGAGGNLFLPVDTTIMGAGPFNVNFTGPMISGNFSQNRATLHLHGGATPWISDGTPHQWTTPANESTPYPKGVSVAYVPDMDNGSEPQGTLTFYYTNQQSARLMFYHDHAYGITRLNVYAGEAAAYLETDAVEQALINGGTVNGTVFTAGTLPDVGIPLVIQDKTFLPGATQLAAEDPTWPFALNASRSDLWFPHVYMPNQNPSIALAGGINPNGRWDYSYWVWPFAIPVNGLVPNPLCTPTCPIGENPQNPGVPTLSAVPEAFVDTPVVNGNLYPYLPVGQKTYRFRILNAANDRMLNLQVYYASTAGPFVRFSGGGGSGASATATVSAAGVITNLTITSGGAGYTSAPTISIFDAPGHTPAGSGATATATIDPVAGTVNATLITAGGTGYSIPTVCNGTAVPNQSLCTEISMVPAVVNPAIPFPSSWLVSGGPTLPPDIMDNRIGGIPDPRVIGPSIIQIGTEGGFLPMPAIIPNRPVGFEKNPKSITITNVFERALFMGPAERADVLIDFAGVANGSTLILYNDAPAPVPAFDTRNDYYTGDPDQTTSGGAPETLPGYGPNTRTVMQFRVNGALGTAAPYNLAALNTSLPAAYGVYQEPPIVPQAVYNAAFNASYPVDAYARISDINLTFAPAGSAANVTIQFSPKSIVEDFDVDYGRMNAMLGTELLLTNLSQTLAQTTVPFYFIDPPSEIINNSNASVLIGTLGDGTQIWKITHNGVDTHAIHVHMFNAQLINRIGWDGTIKPPDPNEEGWKDTIRMNPLEDVIVALRPIKPVIPWDIPNSIRPMDVTAPLGTAALYQFHNQDPFGNPTTVVNHVINYGWEYVWHCHLLGHEENDMMRPMLFADAPNAPVNLAAAMTNNGAGLTWTDNSTNEINFTVQRLNASNWTTIAMVPSATGPARGATVSYMDNTAANNTVYSYRVLATNVVGDTTTYAGSVGYPISSADSVPSNTAVTTTAAPVLVTSPSANPATILNDNGRARTPGTNITTLTVTVAGSVASVTVDLSPIGGSAATPMTNVPGTLNYTVTTDATAGINLTSNLAVTATGIGGGSSSVSIPLTVLRRGDVVRDNLVNAADALYILRATVGLNPMPSALVGDVTGDGTVNAADALYILRYTVGLEVAP
jgi:FtsP/CotA-like multicopper oxidase with cupredoxin domain